MYIFDFIGKQPAQKEWDAVCKKEQVFLQQRHKKKETRLNAVLAKKVPEKLQIILNTGFERAFSLVFERGTQVIEMTYNRQEKKKDFTINLYADKIHATRQSLRVFSKKANQASNMNVAFSCISGIGMGLIGIGIPDIPIFTAMLLKCVYEIALSYGFDYRLESERYWILLIIEGAVSYGQHLLDINEKIDSYMYQTQMPNDCNITEQIKRTSQALSHELLYTKFLQGLPVMGIIGGTYDAVYMNRISEYVRIKYKKRFLLTYKAKELKDTGYE